MTYLFDPSLFFVRKMTMKAEFLQLEKDLTAYGNEQNVKTSLNIKQGTIAHNASMRSHFYSRLLYFTDDVCIVKQEQKNEWHRGRVKSMKTTDNGETLYDVIYIDYGNEECSVETSRVQEIPEHLRALPPQASRCSLHGLVPKNMHWSNASTNVFLQLTRGA